MSRPITRATCANVLPDPPGWRLAITGPPRALERMRDALDRIPDGDVLLYRDTERLIIVWVFEPRAAGLAPLFRNQSYFLSRLIPYEFPDHPRLDPVA